MITRSLEEENERIPRTDKIILLHFLLLIHGRADLIES